MFIYCGLWWCVTIVTITPSFVYQLSYWELWGSCKCWAIFFVKQHSETSENKHIGLGQFGFFCASGSSFTWGDPSITQRLEKGHLWAQTYYGLSQRTRYDFCVRPPKKSRLRTCKGTRPVQSRTPGDGESYNGLPADKQLLSEQCSKSPCRLLILVGL